MRDPNTASHSVFRNPFGLNHLGPQPEPPDKPSDLIGVRAGTPMPIPPSKEGTDPAPTENEMGKRS